MEKPLNFENRGGHNDLINTHVDTKHEHSLGNYIQSNSTSDIKA